MRRMLRAVGNVLLGLLMLVGVLSACVWGATAAGWIQPVVVVSGSMTPDIAVGDLLIDRPVDTDDVEVGDVLTIRSELTGEYVTHRVVDIEHDADGGATVYMQGDANPREDVEPYEVGDEVLSPVAQIPGVGHWLAALQQPGVVIGLLVAVAAGVGLALLGPEPPRGPEVDAPEDADGRDGTDGPDDADGAHVDNAPAVQAPPAAGDGPTTHGRHLAHVGARP